MFKVGDKVKYIGELSFGLQGHKGIIYKIDNIHSIHVLWEKGYYSPNNYNYFSKEKTNFTFISESLQKIKEQTTKQYGIVNFMKGLK